MITTLLFVSRYKSQMTLYVPFTKAAPCIVCKEPLPFVWGGWKGLLHGVEEIVELLFADIS